MANDTSESAWTLQGIRVALLDGKNPRDIGGEDARSNKPLPHDLYLPIFLRELHTRAEALCHSVVDWASGAFQQLAAALRGSPFALDSVSHKVEVAVHAAAAAIDGRLGQIAAEVSALRQSCEVAGTTYRRDLQAADTSHPRGGWPDSSATFLTMLAVLLLETAVSALWLRHALGLPKATATGFAFSLAAVGGGSLCAFVLLGPTKHGDATARTSTAQVIVAIAIALLTLFFMYVGACYRAALIDGLNGDNADTWAKFSTPAEVLINFDVLALFLLGLAGFAVGIFKTCNYFHGHRPLLRKSGIAQASAEVALVRMANSEKRFVTQTAADCGGRLDEIDQSNAEWARATAGHADEAALIAVEGNRRIDLVRLIFPNIGAEYFDGHIEVRPTDRFAPLPIVAIGVDVDVPAAIAATRERAIDDARQAARAVQQGRVRITQIEAAAIVRIDEMAGFRPIYHQQGQLQSGGPPS
ncbi:MAG: hypothetical protein ABIV25_13195 [Paracoccaceae bacterium]